MTYSTGNLIQASDYNTFTTTSGGLNDIWATGSGDKGWGQTAFSSVAINDQVTATQWATLVNNLATAGSQTNTTLTSRTAPQAGNIISVLANVSTDITSVTTNRGNAAAAGTEYGTFTGSVSKTTATSNGTNGAWTITFTHTVAFASANAARYFWNAGGRVRLQYGKSSVTAGVDSDADWNTFIGYVGSIYISGRVNGATQTIASTPYTGTTRIGGTGGTQTTLTTTTGWYSLTAGAAATTVFQLNDTNSPYTGDTIITTAAVDAGRTTLTLVTTFNSTARTGAGQTTNISGGTAVTSPATSIGAATAPTVLCTYIPPSTSYLTASWGTPTITASVA